MFVELMRYITTKAVLVVEKAVNGDDWDCVIFLFVRGCAFLDARSACMR
jgi:hypothetical protein